MNAGVAEPLRHWGADFVGKVFSISVHNGVAVRVNRMGVRGTVVFDIFDSIC